MQENRSFDHSYGTLQGVRGFNDPRAIRLPNNNLVWLQTNEAGDTYLPFRLDIKQTKITWMGSLPHTWTDQVDARNNGKYDRWLDVKKPWEEAYAHMPLTMGYYTREDIPFYYALADAFTICDQHFCSSLTGTTPNRLHFWTGTIREEQNENSKANVWNGDADHYTMVSWKTFPERLEENGISDWAKRPIRNLSKGMAQTVQVLGTLIHDPQLIVLDEPFSGLDPMNQGKLERIIRDRAAQGVTIIFSTHVIAHAERLCERIAIVAAGKVAFNGRVDEARSRLRPIVRLRTRELDGPWRSALPASAREESGDWIFELPESGPEPLLKALIDGGAGIETLAIERPGLHDAFVAIAGEATAKAMGDSELGE